MAISMSTQHIIDAMCIFDNLRILGNGDLEQGNQLVAALVDRLTHARTQHPEFAENKVMAWHVISIEANELCQAVCCESDERVQDELLDVLATSVRMYNAEYVNPCRIGR